ncbi:MAG: hypothetical protein LBK76_04390 [Verrucomicrobiales bacterium]|nr:hypothetical protein [Verrucomicrobiales bacterium]
MTGQDWLADLAGELVNSGVLQFATAQVTADAVDNRGGQFGGGTVTVSAGGLFDNTAGGSLLAEVGASISAAQIANGGGYLLGGAWIELSAAGDLDNAGGVIWSGGSLAASSDGGSLLNRAGYVLADGDLDLRVWWHIDNPNDSVIQAGGNAYLRAARIDNGSPADYRLTSIRDGAGYTDVYVTRVLSGAPAIISADGSLTIVAGADDDTAGGVLFNESSIIGAGGNLNIAAARFDNHATAFQDYDYDETGGVSHIPKNVPYIVAYDPAFEDRWALFDYFAREIGGVTAGFRYDKTDNQWTWVNVPATVQAGGNITVSVGEFINTGYFHGRDLVRGCMITRWSLRARIRAWSWGRR